MRFIGIVLALVVAAAMIVGGYYGVGHDEAVGVTHTTAADLNESPAQAKDRQLAAVVLDDAQETWRGIFARAGRHYEAAKLVLYRDQSKAACGFGPAATGPFYCPSDDHVYVDLSFDDELASKIGDGGDAAQAYVLAHEIGHHVQKLLGATAIIKSFRRSQREGEEGANVRLELQADCYAGVWAHSTEKRGLLGADDIRSAMTAAAGVGSARRQRLATVSPETFTYATIDQRQRWFDAGFEHGDVESCDTFSASGL